MRMNNKGFVVEGAIVIGILASLVTVVLWKPITSTLGIGNQPQKQQSTIIKKTEAKPVMYYKDEKGNEHVAMATSSYESNVEASEDRVMTLWQKFKVFIIAIVALCIAFPSFGIWLYTKLRQAQANFKQVVTGIEEAKLAMPKESVDILKTQLSRKMDSTAKTAVKNTVSKLP